MDWRDEWALAQRDLSEASRSDLWWRTLPDVRRRIIGRAEYRAKCRDARQRLKAADARCRLLLRQKRGLEDATAV